MLPYKTRSRSNTSHLTAHGLSEDHGRLLVHVAVSVGMLNPGCRWSGKIRGEWMTNFCLNVLFFFFFKTISSQYLKLNVNALLSGAPFGRTMMSGPMYGRLQPSSCVKLAKTPPWLGAPKPVTFNEALYFSLPPAPLPFFFLFHPYLRVMGVRGGYSFFVCSHLPAVCLSMENSSSHLPAVRPSVWPAAVSAHRLQSRQAGHQC